MKTFDAKVGGKLRQDLVAPVGAMILTAGLLTGAQAQETIGGGNVDNPAVAPAPAYSIGGTGFVPVKNWNFGANGTIKNITDMNTEFKYQDQFNTIANGVKYGALMVAPSAATAKTGQPIEDPANPVRQFMTDSLRTYLVPLNGATTVTPTEHNVGCGSFMAKWTLPKGGSLLNKDIVWETRVRYVTPPYFWFALWTAGNKWDQGAEYDLIESFGYDNGGGYTNYTGRYWHSGAVGGTSATNYHANWGNAMASRGVTTFDATQYHTWTWLYRRDNTYSAYMDGIEVQNGTLNWNLHGDVTKEALSMFFLFDAGWGHTQVASVNKPLAASALAGKYYEFDYSRVYLREPNLAQGKTVTASSTYEADGWSLPRVVDGNRNTIAATRGWASNGTLSSNHTEWLKVDLGASNAVHKVVLYPRNDGSSAGVCFPIDYNVQISTDNVNWTTVATRTNQPLPGSTPQSVTFTAAQARYVKVTGTNLRTNPLYPGAYRMIFAEVEVY